MPMMTKTILDEVLDLYQDQGASFEETPAYQALVAKMNTLCSNLTLLTQENKAAIVGKIIGEIHDASTDPVFAAEMHGFREGFKAALRLKFDLAQMAGLA